MKYIETYLRVVYCNLQFLWKLANRRQLTKYSFLAVIMKLSLSYYTEIIYYNIILRYIIMLY